MPRFRIYGTNAETGEDVTPIIEVADLEEAKLVASHRGISINRITKLEWATPPTVSPTFSPVYDESTYLPSPQYIRPERYDRYRREIGGISGLTTAFCICQVIGVPLFFLSTHITRLPGILTLLGDLGVITSAVIFYILLYNLWRCIPAKNARTSPAKAVGLSLIPIFNIFWFFVAVYGLAEDLNRELKRRERAKHTKVREELALAYCMLILVGTVWSVIALLFGVASDILFFISGVGILLELVVVIILVLQMKEAATAIIRSNRVAHRQSLEARIG